MWCSYTFVFLQIINLRRNRFREFQINFEVYRNLTEIDMGNNKLSKYISRSKNILKHRNLKKLVLDKCGALKLPSRMLQRVPSLQYINLAYNRIKSIPTGFFHYTIHLKAVSLAGNRLISLYNIFLKNNVLSYVNLQQNRLENLENTFTEVYSLEVLLLNHNKLALLREKDFKYLYSLKKLSISNNNIARMDKNVFLTTKSLKVLILNSNNISSLNGTIGNLPSLEFFSLKYNKLRIVSERDMANMRHLKHLNLRNNLLESVSGTFRNLENLRYLNLQQNNLKTLPRTSLPPAMKLEVLRLSSKQNYISVSNFLGKVSDWFIYINYRVLCNDSSSSKHEFSDYDFKGGNWSWDALHSPVGHQKFADFNCGIRYSVRLWSHYRTSCFEILLSAVPNQHLLRFLFKI